MENSPVTRKRRADHFRLFALAMDSLYRDDVLELAAGKVGNIPFDHDVFEKAARKVFEQQGFSPDMLALPEVRSLIEETYRSLDGAVSSAISTETPPELTAALRNNTFIFSGFKTYHSLSEVGLALTDTDGKAKSYDAFRRDVLAIDKRYNTNYLYAEYNHAVRSSQMAVKWHDVARDGDRYLLQYRTAGDERVREAHAALHNTTLPPSDPFWDSFLPPNGWNCRCQAVQVLRDDYPVSDSAAAIAAGEACTSEPKQQIFRFNPGKQLKVFPPKHPYLPKGCGSCSVKNRAELSYDPSSQRCRACKIIVKCAERATQLYLDKVVETARGGSVERYHNLKTDTDDYKRIESVARAFAENGSHVVITPAFASPENCPAYDNIYGSLKGSPYYGKCPDFSVDGIWYEHEGFTSNVPMNAMKNMLSHGLVQSSRIVIEDAGLSDNAILNRIQSRIRQGQIIDEVWIHSNGNIRLIYTHKNTTGS